MPSGDRFDVRSPVRGRVLRLLRESESVVAPGTPILEIADPSALEVVVDVLSTDAVQIPPRAAVRIERWGGPRPLEGRVRLVEPAATTRVSALGVEEQRVDVIVDLTSPPADRAALGDGYRVEAHIEVFRDDQAVRAPLGALFREEARPEARDGGSAPGAPGHGERWACFVVDGGRARKRVVTVARRNAEEALITGGLAPGDRVILHPGDQIRDGVRVTGG